MKDKDKKGTQEKTEEKESLYHPEIVENLDDETYEETLKRVSEQISQACQKYVSGLEKAKVKSSIIENFKPEP